MLMWVVHGLYGEFKPSGPTPTPLFLPGESHGWRSLEGYIPWGHKELDMTERLTNTHTQPGDICLELCVRIFKKKNHTGRWICMSFNLLCGIFVQSWGQEGIFQKDSLRDGSTGTETLPCPAAVCPRVSCVLLGTRLCCRGVVCISCLFEGTCLMCIFGSNLLEYP